MAQKENVLSKPVNFRTQYLNLLCTALKYDDLHLTWKKLCANISKQIQPITNFPKMSLVYHRDKVYVTVLICEIMYLLVALDLFGLSSSADGDARLRLGMLS